ncbi:MULTISPECIES: vitamin B12 ABC transporter permease BtuC [unclassified Vibrio]|uniref:Vitamin B12 ABC transporter permease BtuC n=1 Tax=Vibrio sp. HB236076 TaxID=3232307 RepID=A0AB39HIC7_9VIBR|nr:vitamin B12 ABC transporter permease BtuC [Vibrio sp. HB161653]MDP5253471.1 vitamin B12 ABC transporter permease BtuC [Vibrio sp. HB161653]
MLSIDYFAQRHRRRQRQFLCVISVLVLAMMYLYLASGEVWVSPFSVLHSQNTTGLAETLLWEIRLPRLLSALLVGASLAVSGACLQVLLGNALAEPGVLGISGGASVLMVMVMLCFPQFNQPWALMMCAVLGALLFTLILLGISRRYRMSTSRLLLVGVALGILSSAGMTWGFYFSDQHSLRQLIYWLMGSLSGSSWSYLWVSLLMFPALCWLLCQGHALDQWTMGEQHARQLGLATDRLRWRLIIAVAVLVGGAVAIAGIVSFVGLIVPHLVRLLCGAQHRFVLLCSALGGALLVGLSDLGARTLLESAELPLGVVTTSLGAPVFIWMLMKHYDHR